MDVMVDIETLGLVPKSVITQIGVMPFKMDGDFFSMGVNLHVDVDSCLKNMGIIQGQAFYWTVQNNLKSVVNEARKSSINDALKLISLYIRDQEPEHIWAKGPQFDCTILESWFNHFELPIPWEYHQLKDVRTVEYLAKNMNLDLTDIYEKYKDSLHDALADCKLQIDVCKKVLGSVGKSI